MVDSDVFLALDAQCGEDLFWLHTKGGKCLEGFLPVFRKGCYVAGDRCLNKLISFAPQGLRHTGQNSVTHGYSAGRVSGDDNHVILKHTSHAVSDTSTNASRRRRVGFQIVENTLGLDIAFCLIDMDDASSRTTISI